MVDNLMMWIANHLPNRITEWAFVRVAVFASWKLKDKELCSITICEALDTWKEKA